MHSQNSQTGFPAVLIFQELYIHRVFVQNQLNLYHLILILKDQSHIDDWCLLSPVHLYLEAVKSYLVLLTVCSLSGRIAPRVRDSIT